MVGGYQCDNGFDKQKAQKDKSHGVHCGNHVEGERSGGFNRQIWLQKGEGTKSTQVQLMGVIVEDLLECHACFH